MPVATRSDLKRLLKKEPHLHACADCKTVYSCVAPAGPCQVPDTNGRCQDCRGTPRPLWEAAREPQACCVGNTVLVATISDLGVYRLGGPGPWFRCQKCCRCQGFPVTETWWRDHKEQEQASGE